jgi:hypothetical protein
MSAQHSLAHVTDSLFADALILLCLKGKDVTHHTWYVAILCTSVHDPHANPTKKTRDALDFSNHTHCIIAPMSAPVLPGGADLSSRVLTGTCDHR